MQNPLDITRHHMLSAEYSNQLKNSLTCEAQGGHMKMLNPKVEMMWKINNFTCFIDKNGQWPRLPVNSPIVFAGVHGVYAIHLSFYFGQDEYTSMYIYVSNIDTKKDVKVKYQIDALDSEGSVFKSFYVKEIVSRPFGYATGFVKFLKRSDILNPAKSLLLNNQFRVRCFVDIYDKSSRDSAKIENRVAPPNFLQQLRHDETFSDAIFFVSNQRFPAHKNILAARSSIFRAMFTKDMREMRTNQFFIFNVKPEVFKTVLDFVYSGIVEINADIAHELLMAADMYALDDLKNLCEAKLSSEINVNNVIDTLIVADRHRVPHLRQQALNFISSHANAVTNTPRYKIWCTSGDPLFGEAFQALAKDVGVVVVL